MVNESFVCVCTKLEPTRYETDEILGINALQIFSPMLYIKIFDFKRRYKYFIAWLKVYTQNPAIWLAGLCNVDHPYIFV